VRDRDEKLAPYRADPAAFEAEAAAQLKRRPGQHAPAACVDSVRLCFTMPIDAALAQDTATVQTLLAGDQSRALRHVFFAEREAAKLPDLPAGVSPRPVRKAVVIGAGTMGGGIAMCLAAAGIPVVLVDAAEPGLNAGMNRIKNNYATSVKRGSISQPEVDKRFSFITFSTNPDTTADADVIIEAVFESLELKQEIFADLARKTRPGVVLATNTSALDIDDIASATDRPEDVVGMHFFSPANVMRLLEVVRGAGSGWAPIATAMALGKAIGKVPVISGNCDGFIGNRMVAKRSAQVDRLLLEGAMPNEIDAATKGLGFAMGPLETNDMSGLDIGWSIRKRRGTPFPIADAICERGWFGQKTGRGYYRYESGSRVPMPNPEVEALVLQISAERQIVRRTITRQELTERMVYPLINEGARILEEGIAVRAGDIDVVWVNGYGFPAWRGGPMFYADLIGLKNIVGRLDEFAAQTGNPDLQPARLLRMLAERQTTFSAWDKDRTLAS
jgi:3-hydroxyacyl-CoA dehydrogenase